MCDATITERQRNALVEVYRSFQAETAAERSGDGDPIAPVAGGAESR
jgi:hypothetical protein